MYPKNKLLANKISGPAGYRSSPIPDHHFRGTLPPLLRLILEHYFFVRNPNLRLIHTYPSFPMTPMSKTNVPKIFDAGHDDERTSRDSNPGQRLRRPR